MTNTVRARYIVIVVFCVALSASYWFADASPWIFAIAAAAFLVSVGITIAKQRAGHFDKN
jgi:L-asparagine transporter-like permease